MKKFSFIVGWLALLCNCTLFSSTRQEPQALRIQAEWIYLCPTLDDTYYAVDAIEDGFYPQGDRYNNNPNFHSGFRLEGVYEFCENFFEDVRVRWTRLHTHNNDTVSNVSGLSAVNVPTQFFAGFFTLAASEIHFDYQNFEALAGINILDRCRFGIDLRGGFQYVSADLKLDTTYRGGDAAGISQTLNSKFKGVGPEIAVAGDYRIWYGNLCWCEGDLSAFGLASFSFLVSSSNSTINSSQSSVRFLSKDQKNWRLVPSWYFRTGLSYIAHWRCFDVSLEIGYEFVTFSRALVAVMFANNPGFGHSFQNYKGFGAHGPFAAVGISF